MDLVEIVRSEDLVDRGDAVSAFSVLVPLVEAGPNDEAVDAARRVLERMPATDCLTAVLEWWLVVTTRAKAPVGTAYHLPDEISGELRDAMEALIVLDTPVPPARWLAARRELAQRLEELDDRLELDFYGKSRLPREREVWAELLQWIRPVVEDLRSARRSTPFDFDSARYERELKRADISPNSRRWREMVKRAEQLSDFVNGLVGLQDEVKPWVVRGESPTVHEVPDAIRRACEPLTEALLHPVIGSHGPAGGDDQERRRVEHVAGELQRASDRTDDDGRFWLAMVASTWMERHGRRIAVLDDVRRRHDAVRDGVERLRELGEDMTEIDVALLDHGLVEAERLLEAETERVSHDRHAEQLRRQADRLQGRAVGTELEGTAEWASRFEDIARSVGSGDHRGAARALGEADRRLQAVTRDSVLRRAGELLDELERLGASRSLLLERRALVARHVAEPQAAVGQELTDDLEDAADQLRRRRRAEAEGNLEEAKHLLDAERSSIGPDVADQLELALTSVESDLTDGGDLASALAGVQRVLAEIGRHRVRRWGASEGEQVLVDHLLAYCTQQLHFERDDVLRLYVALKTKPFVILAGLTGSGKSTVARLMAEAVGSTASNGAFRRVAVRPDWIDQSEVLGHMNPLSRRFEPGWLAEVARDCERSPERLFVVLLDEMNLAPVEQYMAEYLSAIEEARSGASDVRLPLYPRGSAPENGDEWPHELPFPPNLWLVGTVNVDETTRALSERVLDRANVIQLSVDVSDDHHGVDGPAVQPWLVPYGEWRQLCRPGPVDGHHDFLVDIAHTLKEVGIGVGARAHVELERFLANAAGVIDEEDALDLGVLQRIIPKVRGFKRDLVEGLEQFRSELESVGCDRCVRVVDRWLDPRTSEDEYLDGTDARIALVT